MGIEILCRLGKKKKVETTKDWESEKLNFVSGFATCRSCDSGQII